jgi:hypothetical protein
MWNLTAAEERLFKKLRTPQKIQDFLDTIPINYEKKGDTHLSPRMVIQQNKAHCIEGAAFAAAVLWYHGHTPYLMDFTTKPHDEDHVIAPFAQNGYWGAISKTNHNILRWRDPVFKTPRELAMSYFHEYLVYKSGEKTLVSFSKPVSLAKHGRVWITSSEDLWWLDKTLDAAPHLPAVPTANKKFIRPADILERSLEHLREWKRSDPRT